LEKVSAQLKDDGYAWVEVIPQLDYSTLSTYGRVHSIVREPNKKEQAKLDKLQAARDEKQATDAGEDEDRLTELDDRTNEIDAEIEALQDSLRVPDPEQQALAGAIVSISHGGELRIEEGLLKPEDAKRFAREQKTADKATSPTGPRVHSAALVRRLTAHRTLALRAMLAQRPDIALVALTHRLALGTFFNAGYPVGIGVQIEAEETALDQYAPDTQGCKAQAALAGQREAIVATLPGDPSAVFMWLLQQPQDAVLRLCAYCVAVTVNGVRADEDRSAVDPLVNATGLDMCQWWQPTADGYLGSIPKARILEIVREAVSPEAAATLTSLKKGPLAKVAEQKLAGTGWLPSPLRSQTI